MFFIGIVSGWMLYCFITSIAYGVSGSTFNPLFIFVQTTFMPFFLIYDILKSKLGL